MSRPARSPSPWAGAKRHKSGCWMFAKAKRGEYGTLRHGGQRHVSSRLAWSLAYNSPIPLGCVVAHDCDRPGCIRPGHIFLTTQLGNAIDMRLKGREGAPGRRGRRSRHDRTHGHWLFSTGWLDRENRKARRRALALKAIFAALVLREAA